MSYEQSKFGDGSTAGNGNVVTTVNNHYGARDIGGTVGRTSTDGFMNELTIDLNGDIVENEAFVLLPPTIPALSNIVEVFLEVEEAFDLTGTTPVIAVGTESSETTNGVEISETQAENVGMYDITSTLKGTWAATGGLTADTVVGIAKDGTNPVSASDGKARLIIRYANA